MTDRCPAAYSDVQSGHTWFLDWEELRSSAGYSNCCQSRLSAHCYSTSRDTTGWTLAPKHPQVHGEVLVGMESSGHTVVTGTGGLAGWQRVRQSRTTRGSRKVAGLPASKGSHHQYCSIVPLDSLHNTNSIQTINNFKMVTTGIKPHAKSPSEYTAVDNCTGLKPMMVSHQAQE